VQAAEAVARHIDDVAVLDQALPDIGGRLGLVFDDEDAHRITQGWCPALTVCAIGRSLP